MEKHFAFVKNNRVLQIAVFASQDQELANQIAQEQGFDNAIWIGETNIPLYSEYDGKKFIDPTDEYLISIGIMIPPADPIIEETPAE